MLTIENRVLLYIRTHASSGAPATRNALAGFCGADDREVRDAVKALRRKGKPIVSFSGRAGYWLAESREELERFKAECRHRADDLYTTTRAMKLDGGGSEPMEAERL